jgi:hypothetical protein
MTNGEDVQDKAVEVEWNASIKVTKGPSLSLAAKPAVRAGQYVLGQYELGAAVDKDSPTTVGHVLPESASSDPHVFVIRRGEVKEDDKDKGVQYCLVRNDKGNEEESSPYNLLAPHFVTGPSAKDFLKNVTEIKLHNNLNRSVRIDVFIAYGDAPPPPKPETAKAKQGAQAGAGGTQGAKAETKPEGGPGRS